MCQPVATDDEYNVDTEPPTDENEYINSDFVCQPVAADDEYNADTEPPTDEDEYINSVADPELQTQLRWEKYVRQGAWGDHITIQAIADMLSVKINVLSSDYPAVSVTPSNSNATCEVSVGLIRQYHYVGLDKMCDSGVEGTAQNAQSISKETVANTDSHNTETADDALDDAMIEEDDSLVKTLEGLHIVNFNAKAIKKSIDVANEMIRLNTNILPPVTQMMCCLNIALLNVRSIVAKLQDINCDTYLRAASIQLFL